MLIPDPMDVMLTEVLEVLTPLSAGAESCKAGAASCKADAAGVDLCASATQKGMVGVARYPLPYSSQYALE